MSLVPGRYKENDVVELTDGRYAVLLKAVDQKHFEALVIQPWLESSATKPKPGEKHDVALADLKCIIEDAKVSWVSPAYLHLTCFGPYTSEYEVANKLTLEHGKVVLCVVNEDRLVAVTKGLFVFSDGAIVVTARSNTQPPASSVLKHVTKHVLLDPENIPQLARYGSNDVELDDAQPWSAILEQALQGCDVGSKEFFSAKSGVDEEPWWAREVDGVIAAGVLSETTMEQFVQWCLAAWRKQRNIVELNESRDEKLEDQFKDLWVRIKEFHLTAVPSCIAWLGDDRWSAHALWKQAREGLQGSFPPSSPHWNDRQSVAHAADVAAQFEEYLVDESLLNLGGQNSSSAMLEVLSFGVVNEKLSITEKMSTTRTGIYIQENTAAAFLKFAALELGVGIVEVLEPMNLKWSGEDYEALNDLRQSKPELVIIEGSAGTGKTITMAHRAVDAAGRVDSVLIIVPTHTFKRRLKYILRRVGYRGQSYRRNDIKISTPDLLGEDVRRAGSAKAYKRKTGGWGRPKHKNQWNKMLADFKTYSGFGLTSDLSSLKISHDIAVEEIDIHMKLRAGEKVKEFVERNIPSYGAIFIDEAQDLKGWDWIKVASYSYQYARMHIGESPELGVFVDRRQDTRGLTPNFDVEGPDEDPETQADLEDSDDARPIRSAVGRSAGILKTPLFNLDMRIGKEGTALSFGWAPEKALRRFAMSTKGAQEVRKRFQEMGKSAAWPIVVKSLTVTLRQSEALANHAASIARAIEEEYGLGDSRMNQAPMDDILDDEVWENIRVSSHTELLFAIEHQIKRSDLDPRLTPLAITARTRDEVLALTLCAASVTNRLQSPLLITNWVNYTVRNRDQEPFMTPDVQVISIAPKLLGDRALSIVVPGPPSRRNGLHRGLHRVGNDCVAFPAQRLSTRNDFVSLGTITHLKGLEFGSLVGVASQAQPPSRQEQYVQASRPRYKLVNIEVQGTALLSSKEYVCATLIHQLLPPWGGTIFCELDHVANEMSQNWEELQVTLKAEKVKLTAKWKSMSGQYGADDLCYKVWGPFSQKTDNSA